MAFIAEMIATATGDNVQVAREGAFFHDLGKSIDLLPANKNSDNPKTHDVLSKEILDKFDWDPRVSHCAHAHHLIVQPESNEAWITIAADSISGGRPGARQETLVDYFERIKKLEDTVKSHDGLKKVFAISAGREVRGMIDPKKVKDEDMEKLAGDIAETIEHELTYPGQIKVNLIRRTQSVDVAK